ncbi:MAG: ribosome small subunit-dependent GTPase A [Rhodospirillales bacterium 20-64-7]|nr:MAG: ribosome small subunit-dependent GTPase A [Rhodospirillales bacterium 20-64-7]
MIETYGWRVASGLDFAPFAARGLRPGRVILQQRGHCTLATDFGELAAGLAGRLLHDGADPPVAGDWVACACRPAEGAATIHAVLPRRTCFTRQRPGGQGVQVVAANIDVALLATSMNAEFNPRRLERYLAAAWASGARPVVVLTKADLCSASAPILAAAQAVAIGVEVLAVSAATGTGLDRLAALLRPRETCAVLGSSGVGKSSLVNALAGQALMATGDIREADARGRHTTTHRELLVLPGGRLVLDTPGMRELGLAEAAEGVAATFEDIAALAADCRFHDCAHASEPGCAVQAALAAGALDPGRWKSYQKLQRELAHATARGDQAARAAQHKRWVALTKSQRAARKFRQL